MCTAAEAEAGAGTRAGNCERRTGVGGVGGVVGVGERRPRKYPLFVLLGVAQKIEFLAKLTSRH